MRVLLIGGSGYVGGLVLSVLAKHHSIRILDLNPPPVGPWEYVCGDVADLKTLDCAVERTDSLIYMAKGLTDDDRGNKSVAVANAFDVSVKGLYFALDAARKAGTFHAVYTSTMSIYDGPTTQRYFHDEDLMPDALDVYGFTKSLGEEVCRFAVRSWGMTVNALRLCLPLPMQSWNTAGSDSSLVHATASDDVASALLAALTYRRGFEAFMISGDKDQIHTNLLKAKRLLNWEPHARCLDTSGSQIERMRSEFSQAYGSLKPNTGIE